MKKIYRALTIFVLLNAFCINTFCQSYKIDEIVRLESDSVLKFFYKNLKIHVDTKEHSQAYRSENGETKLFKYEDYFVEILNDKKLLFSKQYLGHGGSYEIEEHYGLPLSGEPQSGDIDLFEICDFLLKGISEEYIVSIARNATFRELGICALKRISNQNSIADIVKNAKDENVREEAILINSRKIGTFQDVRDGHVYKTVKIGNQWIMAENFAFKPQSGKYWVCGNRKKNLAIYGYLYDWETVKTITPSGWHLPTEEEWEKLIIYLGSDSQKAFIALIDGGSSGFNALMGGCYTDRKDDDFGKAAYFWSASANDVIVNLFQVSDNYGGIVADVSVNGGYSVRFFRDN
jgi:uncharacterized protein (TIGR02145 family)